jgi:hypothetical protein
LRALFAFLLVSPPPPPASLCLYLTLSLSIFTLFSSFYFHTLPSPFNTLPFKMQSCAGVEEEVRDDVRGREDDLPPLPPRLYGEHPRQGDPAAVCHREGGYHSLLCLCD